MRVSLKLSVIHFLYPSTQGNSLLRNPIKMYPENPNLIHVSYLPTIKEATIGKMRESFVVNQMKTSNIPIFSSKAGDFLIDTLLVEVGGKKKTASQLKGDKTGIVLADGILTGAKNTIPLYLLGCLS